MPIIRKYLDRYEIAEEEHAEPSVHAPAKIRLLAGEAGIPPSRLQDILTRVKTVRFDDADKLLCAMGGPQTWHEWPLLPFYLTADLSEPVALPVAA